ncbi:MAG: hypothetical protein ACK40R_03475 [Thermomonas sp.]
MRKVFSSPRLENVEAVAQLLRDAGIEVKIEHGRSYRGYRRGNFSYDTRKAPKDIPAVWIVHAEDQPRGRQILRELGLLESSREEPPSYLPAASRGDAPGKGGPAFGKRLKLGLLALIAVVIGLAALHARKSPDAAAPAAPAAATTAMRPPPPPVEAITDVQVFRIDVPAALAARLAEQVLQQRKPTLACLAVDDRDPRPNVLEAMTVPPRTRVLDASACTGKDGLAIAVRDYMTDGSGSGEVSLDVAGQPTQVLAVERTGTRWNILGKAQGAR